MATRDRSCSKQYIFKLSYLRLMRRSWTHCRDCLGKATLFRLDRKALQLGEELQRRLRQPRKSLQRPNYKKVIFKSTTSTLLSISARYRVKSYHLHKTNKQDRPAEILSNHPTGFIRTPQAFTYSTTQANTVTGQEGLLLFTMTCQIFPGSFALQSHSLGLKAYTTCSNVSRKSQGLGKHIVSK
jgi:hypothetical protein